MTPGNNQLRFADHLHDRKPPSGVDVQTALAHFAIITFQVDPDRSPQAGSSKIRA